MLQAAAATYAEMVNSPKDGQSNLALALASHCIRKCDWGREHGALAFVRFGIQRSIFDPAWKGVLIEQLTRLGLQRNEVRFALAPKRALMSSNVRLCGPMRPMRLALPCPLLLRPASPQHTLLQCAACG